MSEFIKLAIKIEKNINGWWHCCKCLPDNEKQFFKTWFEPTSEERQEYNHCLGAWMAEYKTSQKQDNNLRILALLFADQLYKYLNK